MRRYTITALLAVLLCACEGTTYQSSVPTYPVHAVIDTRALFVDFVPENTNAYITINADGYCENGRFIKPTDVTDAWGYGGLLVYVSMNGYVAFDLACPYCAGRGMKKPCTMDGIFAICPHCGERYEIATGYALPQAGISREALRQYNIIQTDGRLTVTQRQ